MSSIVNLKEVFAIVKLESDMNIPDDMFSKVVTPIYEMVLAPGTIKLDIYALRNRLYNLLIFGIDVYESIWFILLQLAQQTQTDPEDYWRVSRAIFDKFYEFMKQYNNNYRSIYHLERIFLTIRASLVGGGTSVL